MIRIRVGENWKLNPAYVGGLKALAEGQSRGFSPRDIVDVLGIEVDGVDLAGGLAEAAILDAMSELVKATRALARSDGEAHVALARAPVELRLVRRADELRLTLRATDGDDLVVRDAVVEPGPFFEAVRGAARRFLADLSSIHPALSELRVVQSLSREAVAPAKRKAPKTPRKTKAPLAEVPLGTGRLEARSGRAGLAYVGDDGRALWSVLRAFSPAISELFESVHGSGPAPTDVSVNRRAQEVRLGRAPALRLGDVTIALRTLARLAEPHAKEADRPLLAAVFQAPERTESPRRGRVATAAVARPDIEAPGLPGRGLRRLLLRPAWRCDAPGPRPRLATAAGLVIVRTAHQVEARDAAGERRWSSSLHDALVVADAARPLVLGREGSHALVFLDARTGERLGRVSAHLDAHLRDAIPLVSGQIAATDGVRIHGLDPSRRQHTWAFDAGPDRTLQLAHTGAGLVAVTDRADVYGISLDGTVAFRSPVALEHVESVRVDPDTRMALLAGLDADGAATVAAVSLDEGRVVWRHAFDGLRPTAPLPFHRRVLFGFEASAGPTLACLDARTGVIAWRAIVPDDGAAVPVVSDHTVLVARVGGGLCVYDETGRLTARQPARDPDPALSPVRPRPVRVGAGLVAIASALVHVYEASTARPLASLEPGELAPESLALLDGPVVVAAGREGLVEAWRAAGHLSVVPE